MQAHPLRNLHALSQHNVLHVHIEVVLERAGARTMVAQPGFRADAARHGQPVWARALLAAPNEGHARQDQSRRHGWQWWQAWRWWQTKKNSSCGWTTSS